MQALVCKIISEAFPEDGIIAEESADVLRDPASSGLLSQVVAAVATAEPSPSFPLSSVQFQKHRLGVRALFWTWVALGGVEEGLTVWRGCRSDRPASVRVDRPRITQRAPQAVLDTRPY